MYEIKGTSWHWKLVSQYGFYRWNRQVSLCRYFWTVVGCVIRKVAAYPFRPPIGLVTIPVLVAVFYLVPVGCFFIGAFSGRFDNLLMQGLVLTGCLETVITVVAALLYAAFYGSDTKYFEIAVYQVRTSPAVQVMRDGKDVVLGATASIYETATNALFRKYVAPVSTAVLIFVFYVIPVFTLYLFRYGFIQQGGAATNWWLAILVLVGLFELVVTAGVVLFGLIAVLAEFVFPQTARAVTNSETCQLVAAFVKAKKEKVCPLLATPRN